MLTHVTRNEEQWDAFVLRHGGGFLQSWGWSQFQEALGRNVFRFRVDGPGENGEHTDTIAQFLLVYHPLPLGRKYAYVPRGPVVALDGGPGTGRSFVETCVGALREAVRREGAVFARVEWPWSTDTDVIGPQDAPRLGFRPVKAVQPADTVIVDLTKSEDELLAGMHQKTRYNARLAEKHGITVREGRHDNAQALRDDIGTFWSMLSETAARDKFHTHDEKYYATMIDVLSGKKSESMSVRFVFAEHEGKPIAAALVGEFGKTATYLHGASLASHRQLMAPNLLHWAIMKEEKMRGFEAYDLWGVAPMDEPDHPWAGITRFKTGFGGDRVSYLGAWELPGDPFWYTLYRYAKRFRNV